MNKIKSIAKLLAFTAVLTASSFASSKPETTYQPAVLKSFRMIESGESCSTSAKSTSYDNSSVNTTASTDCSRKTVAEYTISIDGQILVIEPTYSKGKTAGIILSMGYAALFYKNSTLYGQLPGALVQIRSEDGKYAIKVGKRESLYKLVGAK